jgi:hypothetical protein
VILSPTPAFVPVSDRTLLLALSDEIRRELPETRPGGVAPRERLAKVVIEESREEP